ncbi:hypothetical protein PsorP6_002680 [Peronosclerospora sorghi]|uniref:Uncharacterized protein n=1 Tax=Peronosclerospora sorghi TaxID=230839 RepID=A0ACC0WXA9_9STRA|nr:hypothetical protein PsorP6_002680 [Peronosclerospora sorghi]
MALRQNAYALEAALALTKLAVAEDAAHGAERSARFTGSTTFGISQHEIEKFYQTTATIGEIEDSQLSPRLDVTWMQTLVTAHLDAERGNYCKALESFKFLDRVFPTNLHCLLHKAALEIGQEQPHQAHVTFKRIRQIEDLNISFMDHYANCLRKENLRTELTDLVQQLFSITSTCPESWLAAAYYSDMNEDYETALQYCEHAIEERNDHAPAHLFRGEMLLRLHRPQPALKAFWTASRLTRSLEAYTGIITSYCELFAEAFAAARSVVNIFPKNAQSLVLLGNVLALNPDNRKQARKVLKKALAMEPQKLSTINTLLDLGEHQPREEVFTKLADVYSMDKQYAEALKHLHQALRLNPNSTEVQHGLEHLEKLCAVRTRTSSATRWSRWNR